MRRLLVIAALLAVAASACGASAATTHGQPSRIRFGLAGGNMMPFRVTIEANGTVRVLGGRTVAHRHLSRSQVLSLDARVHRAFRSGLVSRRCAHVNPDVGSDYIRAYGRTVSVQGACEPRFQRLWNALAHAVGLRP